MMSKLSRLYEDTLLVHLALLLSMELVLLFRQHLFCSWYCTCGQSSCCFTWTNFNPCTSRYTWCKPSSSPIIPPVDLIGAPSECLLLNNMFDPNIETESDFDLDIKDDVQDECSKFGVLKHIYVDKNSAGHVYLRFDNTQSAMNAQGALHGRWFAGKMITATYMLPLNSLTPWLYGVTGVLISLKRSKESSLNLVRQLVSLPFYFISFLRF